MNVLIIDDNKDMTCVFSRLLKIEGHECTVSNDGQSGLALLQEQTFDAAVLDIGMPDFSGIKVIDALEKSGTLKEQKIAVLTTLPIPEEKLEELEQRGVHACLRKPLEMDTILKILEKPMRAHV